MRRKPKWTVWKKMMALLLIIFTGATLFIVPFTNYYMSKEITDRSTKYFSAMVNQVADRIDTYILRNEQYVDLLTTRSRMLYQLTDIVEGKLDLQVHAYKIVREILNMKPWDIDSLEGIYIFPIYAQRPINCYYRVPMEEVDPYSQLLLALRDGEEIIWSGYDSEQEVITAHRMLYSSSNRKIGLMKVAFSKSYIEQIIGNVLSDEGMLMVYTDQYGRIVCANDENAASSFSALRTEKQNQTIAVNIVNGWQLTGIIPISRIRADISNYNLIFAGSFFSVFVLMYAILAAYTHRLLRPMRLIMDGMARINGGDINIHLPYTDNVEFDAIIHTFNTMVKTIHERNLTIYKQQKINYEARMNVMQAQKDPHFLYNMLDAIYWKAFSHGENEIAKTVLALAKMLRYSITNAGTFVSVRDDMQQVEQYLIVMQVRFTDKLSYEINVDPELLGMRIPIFLLQPLVENAINHGFKEMCRPGKIVITGRLLQDGSVLFTVEDNGTGFAQRPLESSGAMEGEGVGLRLVRECIEYNYGEPYGLKIQSQAGHTVCMVHIAATPKVIVEDGGRER